MSYTEIKAIVTLIVCGLILAGWVQNIVKLSNCDFQAPYKAEVIYGVGRVPIVGAVTGWIDIEDGNDEL